MQGSKREVFCATFCGVEPLESRLLLAAPVFGTNLTDMTVGAKSILVPINGYDADGDPLTITATSSNSQYTIKVPTVAQDTYAVMHFQDGSGHVLGDIVVQIFTSSNPYSAAAANQWLTLATNQVNSNGTLNPAGTPFYTNVPVHRIMKDFMFQTGDAVLHNGQGNSPLANVQDSFDPAVTFGTSQPGMLAMANTGAANSSNCQFFVTDGSSPFLDTKYMIFGQIVSGWDVFNAIMDTAVQYTVPPAGSGQPELSDPIIDPILTGVTVLSPTNAIAKQNNTLEIVPNGHYAGTSTITVTLNDGTSSVTQTFTLTSQWADVAPIHVKPGTTTTVPLPADAGSLNASVSPLGVGVSVYLDSYNHRLSISTAAGFVGSFNVTLNGGSFIHNVPGISANDTDPWLASGVADDLDGAPTVSYQVGNTLYVGGGGGQVKIFDVSDLQHPILQGMFQTSGTVKQLKVVNSVAYVASGEAGLRTYNVADAKHPQFLDSLSATKLNPSTTKDMVASDVVIQGNIAYVINWDTSIWKGNVQLVDISNPSDLKELTTIRSFVPWWGKYQNGDDVQLELPTMIAFKGSVAYIADNVGYVWVVDAGSPSTIQPRARLITGGNPYGIDIVGNRMYVVDMSMPSDADPTKPDSTKARLLIYDISSAYNPKQLSATTIPYATFVKVFGNTAAVGTGAFGGSANAIGYALVNVARPKTPTILSRINGGAGQLASANEYYIALPQTGLAVSFLALNHTGKTTFTDASGVRVNVSSSGAGVYNLVTSSLSGGNLADLVVRGTNARSGINVSTASSQTVNIDSIDSGLIGSISAATANITGDVTLTGAAGSITLRSITGGTLTVPAAAEGDRRSIRLTLGNLTDATVNCDMPVSKIAMGDVANSTVDLAGVAGEVSAYRWQGGQLNGTAVSKLSITGRGRTLAGDLSAGVDVDSLSKASIAGQILGGTWSVTGATGTITAGSTAAAWTPTFADVLSLTTRGNLALGTLTANSIKKVTVGGDFSGKMLLQQAVDPAKQALGTMTVSRSATDAKIRSIGNIGSITLGRSVNSSFFAGSTEDSPALPDALGLINAQIGTFKIKGMRGEPTAMSESRVVAKDLGTVSILGVADDTNGLASSTLHSLSYKPGKYSWPSKTKNPSYPDDFLIFTVKQLS